MFKTTTFNGANPFADIKTVALKESHSCFELINDAITEAEEVNNNRYETISVLKKHKPCCHCKIVIAIISSGLKKLDCFVFTQYYQEWNQCQVAQDEKESSVSTLTGQHITASIGLAKVHVIAVACKIESIKNQSLPFYIVFVY